MIVDAWQPVFVSSTAATGAAKTRQFRKHAPHQLPRPLKFEGLHQLPSEHWGERLNIAQNFTRIVTYLVQPRFLDPTVWLYEYTPPAKFESELHRGSLLGKGCRGRTSAKCSRIGRARLTGARRQQLLRTGPAPGQGSARRRLDPRARGARSDRAADAPVSATAIGTGDAARVSALPLSSRRRHRPSDAPQVGLGTESEPSLLCCWATLVRPGLRVVPEGL